MTEKEGKIQPGLFELPEVPKDLTDFLTPKGKVKKTKRKSDNSVVGRQMTKKRETPGVRVDRDKGEITKYTQWINDH
ncbi:MAG TPA: hypothetical protein PKI92_02485 [Candidatus Woesebacteria bacterium]|nr:hypothetical protein [Candidatus Woesebacteria bacterium]HPR99538.1 hypothetical protein [Candidatus Woesebacteria bacterium]